MLHHTEHTRCPEDITWSLSSAIFFWSLHFSEIHDTSISSSLASSVFCCLRPNAKENTAHFLCVSFFSSDVAAISTFVSLYGTAETAICVALLLEANPYQIRHMCFSRRKRQCAFISCFSIFLVPIRLGVSDWISDLQKKQNRSLLAHQAHPPGIGYSRLEGCGVIFFGPVDGTFIHSSTHNPFGALDASVFDFRGFSLFLVILWNLANRTF